MLPKETYSEQDSKEQIDTESIGVPELNVKWVQHRDKVVILRDGMPEWAVDPRCPPIDEEGVVLVVKETPFYFRSTVDAYNMFAMNMVKAIIIEPFKLLDWTFIPPLLSIILSKKKMQKALLSFNKTAWKILSPYVLKEEYLSSFAKEIHIFIATFLVNLGMTEHSSNQCARIISHLLENDNAYQLRTKDAFSILDTVTNPRQQLKYLIKEINKRELAIGNKVTRLIKLFRTLLIIPRYKKAFQAACDEVVWSDLRSDENDLYWTAFREDYNYQGLTKKERLEKALKLGWYHPEHLTKI